MKPTDRAVTHLVAGHLVAGHLVAVHLVTRHLVARHLVAGHMVAGHFVPHYWIVPQEQMVLIHLVPLDKCSTEHSLPRTNWSTHLVPLNIALGSLGHFRTKCVAALFFVSSNQEGSHIYRFHLRGHNFKNFIVCGFLYGKGWNRYYYFFFLKADSVNKSCFRLVLKSIGYGSWHFSNDFCISPNVYGFQILKCHSQQIKKTGKNCLYALPFHWYLYLDKYDN